MLTQRQLYTGRLGRVICSGVCAATLLLSPVYASAQTQSDIPEQPSFLLDVAKRVIFDPTTYAPAILGYDATRRDWRSSQPFFQNGFIERNPRFTISGRANDLAVSYGEGNRRIFADAMANLEMSLMNNATDALFERMLAERYPDHRKLIRTLGWIEKSAFASYMSYRLSAAHYRQWQQNVQMSRQLGLRE
jgi:hypothetical protein